VKPGITGWAQVNGWRGETDTPEKIQRRVEHDLYYIENWSVFFDIYILAVTPLALMKSENAPVCRRPRSPLLGGGAPVPDGRAGRRARDDCGLAVPFPGGAGGDDHPTVIRLPGAPAPKPLFDQDSALNAVLVSPSISAGVSC
jgi:hypothetical protein